MEAEHAKSHMYRILHAMVDPLLSTLLLKTSWHCTAKDPTISRARSVPQFTTVPRLTCNQLRIKSYDIPSLILLSVFIDAKKRD